eukprot:15109546-Alexandrium_andersonii.AAC.1
MYSAATDVPLISRFQPSNRVSERVSQVHKQSASQLDSSSMSAAETFKIWGTSPPVSSDSSDSSEFVLLARSPAARSVAE